MNGTKISKENEKPIMTDPDSALSFFTGLFPLLDVSTLNPRVLFSECYISPSLVNQIFFSDLFAFSMLLSILVDSEPFWH